MSKDSESVSLPQDLARLSTLIDEHLEAFASGSTEIQAAALTATKFVFDLTLESESHSQKYISELLDSIRPSQAPQTRAQARAAAQRQKNPTPVASDAILRPTPLSMLFVDGMDEDQVWAQLDLKVKNVCETLEDAFDATGGRENPLEDESVSSSEEDLGGLDDFDGMHLDDEDGPWGMDGLDDDEEDVEGNQDDEDDSADEESGVDEDSGEDITELRDPSSDENEDDEGIDLDRAGPRNGKGRKYFKKGGHQGLDDGFFDLAAFNAETEEAEAQNVSRGKLSRDSDEDSEDDDGALDLFAPLDEASAFEEADEDAETPEAHYKDFFEPPPKALKPKNKTIRKEPIQAKPSRVRFNDEVRVKKIKSKCKSRMLSSMDDGDDDEDEGYDELADGDDAMDSDGAVDAEYQLSDDAGVGRETIQRLKDDLFAEDEATETGLSSHEKRMAALKEQIAALEAENVGKKDWTLMGEATSRGRPQNALLEEDLEFERVMKSVPVVTEEVVHKLEDRIKARILEGKFDDVLRKRSMDEKPFLPSRFFELQDKKSTQSLAQIYEDEFVATQSGGVVDDRDGKLQKEHQEIEMLWEGICGKLDALCNAHFTPKQPKATISSVSNVSTITLESALPTSKSGSTVLAPEEVFAASASDLRARSELTPAEKRALRGKEKKMKKKHRQVLETSVDKFAKPKGVKKQKEAALKSMVKSGKGVTVIGKFKAGEEVKSKKRTVSRS